MLLLLLICAAACKKQKIQSREDISTPPQPSKTKSTISGTISPIGSVAEVKLIGKLGTDYQQVTVVPDDQGKYTFPNMEDGEYVLSLSTTPGFLTPTELRFSVPRAQDLNLANIDVKAVRPLGTSSISGRISPADAAYSVTLTGTKSAITVIVNPSTGNFKAMLLPEDTYTPSFQTGGKYIAPAISAITTQAGRISELGTHNFAANVQLSAVSVSAGTTTSFTTHLNPTANMGSITASLNGAALSISCLRSSGALGTAEGGTVTRLGIRINDFKGTGTYTCDQSTQSKITYYYYNTRLSIAPATDCSSDLEDASATITVTAYDPVKKTIRGTFKGTLKGKRSGVTYGQEISNGSFEISL